VGVIGLDIGGTTIKGGVVGPSGPSAPLRVATERERGPDAVVETVLTTCDRLLGQAASDGVAIHAVGVAVLGLVDEEAGVARWSTSIGWHDVPLQALIAERCGHAVALGHDVRAAALLEATHGVGQAHRHVLFVALGTGLSLASVHDGQVLTGETWRAGEIGQLGVPTLEDIASGRGIAHRYAEAIAVTASTADEVIGLAARGDATAMSILDEAVDALAATLAVAVTVLDPGVVIVGGGVSLAGEPLLARLRPALGAALGWRESPPVVPARFGDEAGWLGAALLAWRLTTASSDSPFPCRR
jgi:glucokinase